jgi:hypothetical protein
MKTYADEGNHASQPDLNVGDVVHMATMLKGGKLDPRYDSKKCVIVKENGDNTFEVVNVDNGKRYVRNAKFLRKAVLHSEMDLKFMFNEVDDKPIDIAISKCGHS